MHGFYVGWPIDLDPIIKTVVRYHHWSPEVINNMYTDDYDHQGLLYWYNDCREQDENFKSKIPKK